MTVACAVSEPLYIRKGETFVDIVRWATHPKLYAAITAITKAAPAVVTATTHGIPDGWPIDRIVSVAGMKEINTHKLVGGAWERTPRGEEFPDGIKARVIDVNTIALDDINASGFSAYTSGGVLEYWTPVNLQSFTARMQVRASPGSGTALIDLTTENAGIVIDNVKRTITRKIAVSVVDALNWTEGVCTLELVSPQGEVTLVEPNRRVIVCDTNVTRT